MRSSRGQGGLPGREEWMIEVEHLTKYYGPFPAVEDISFRAERGEILGFLGPNAAGKTTTMRVLTGYMPATSGTVRVAGFDVARESLDVRRREGYLPETVPLYTEMEVWPYLGFVAELKGIGRSARAAAVAGVVERCDLGAVERQRIGSLSKGYRQRVGLAQALLGDPEVLILDEPTIGLDPRQILEIRRLIKELGGRRTVILSTHILPEVSQTCHRVIIINKGRLVAVDTPENLTAQLQKSARIVVQAAAPAAELARRLGAVRGVARVAPEESGAAAGAASARVMVECERGADPRAELARQVVAAGWDLVELRSVVMTLEDIFIQLVTEEQEVPA